MPGARLWTRAAHGLRLSHRLACQRGVSGAIVLRGPWGAVEMSYWKWAWGLAPLCAFGVAAVSLEQASVEQEVASRAARVAAREAGRIHVSVSGRDVLLGSDVELPAAVAQRLLAHAGEAYGVRRVVILRPEGEAGAPPIVDPFQFEIERAYDGMRVTGHAPGALVRDAVLAAVRTAAESGGLSGEVAVAWGLPAHVDFEVAARFAAVQAARLAHGRVTITGDQLSIAGKTADAAALKALLDALRPPLPGGLRLGAVSVQVAPPMMKPFIFVAERTEGGLALSGGVPAPETRSLLLDMAKEVAGAAVVDRVALASGAHEDFPTFAAFGLMQLSRLAKGRFVLTDTAFSLEGDAIDPAAHETITLALGAVPMGLVAGAVDIRQPPAPPPVLAPAPALPPVLAPAPPAPAQLEAVMEAPAPVTQPAPQAAAQAAPQAAAPACPAASAPATAVVLFASGRAKPSADATSLARDVAALARACAGAVIEVAGHTDAEGGRRRNLRLSYIRARAVARLLEAEGVPRAGIVVRSYAFDRPTASPERDADVRARNRRVEVTVRPGSPP